MIFIDEVAINLSKSQFAIQKQTDECDYILNIYNGIYHICTNYNKPLGIIPNIQISLTDINKDDILCIFKQEDSSDTFNPRDESLIYNNINEIISNIKSDPEDYIIHNCEFYNDNKSSNYLKTKLCTKHKKCPRKCKTKKTLFK